MANEIATTVTGTIAAQEHHREPSVLEIIQAVAADPRADVEKLERLLAMQERIQAREAERVFNVAMKSAQEEMRPVVRDAKNESTNSRYARLETIDAKMRPVYTKHGFSLSFNSGEPKMPGALRIICRVLHEAGHSKEYELEGALDTVGAKGSPTKTSIQGLGSSASYLRRYLTLMVFNVALANEDNDGNKTGWITEQQVDSILGLLKQCGAETDPKIHTGFLDYMRAKTVSEIHAVDFKKAVTILESKLRDIRKKEAEMPEVESLPDPVESVKGKRLRCKGKLWEVWDSDRGHRWREVGK